MPVQAELPQSQLDNVLRMVHSADRDKVLALRNATFNNMKRLGVRRDRSKAVAKMPNGSDQFDLMSIFVWMAKVAKADKAAVEQIIQIDATAVARTGG